MLSLALKNTKRNRRRSILTALASLVSVLVIIIVLAYQLSMVDSLIDTNVLHMTGNIRVRKANYSRYEDAQPMQFYIEDFEPLAEEIGKIEEIDRVEPISRFFVSVYHNNEMKKASLIAVDKDNSSFIHGKGSELLAGHYIEKANEILVSPGFLKTFSKEVGDKITIVTRTTRGGTNGVSFTIAGVLFANDAQIANETIYADLGRVSEIVQMENGAIELLVILKDQDTKVEEYRDIKDKIVSVIEKSGRESSDYQVATWHEVSMVYPFINIFYIAVGVIAFLFFLIASSLIINTTTMSIMERKREVSTLAALGFERKSIRRMFIQESLVISLVGSIIGTVIAAIVVILFGKIGFDVSIFGVEAMDGWGYPKLLYPHLDWYWYVLCAAGMIAITFLASFLTTLKINKIEVTDALRVEY